MAQVDQISVAAAAIVSLNGQKTVDNEAVSQAIERMSDALDSLAGSANLLAGLVNERGGNMNDVHDALDRLFDASAQLFKSASPENSRDDEVLLKFDAPTRRQQILGTYQLSK